MLPALTEEKRAQSAARADKPGMTTGRRGIRNDRPTLALIHGACGSSRSWGGQISPLDRKINVAAPDLPGHGQAAGPPLNRLEDMAAFVIRALEGLPVSGPVVLGGVSLGGAVAMKAALIRPDLVRALVLISTSARFNHHGEMIERIRRGRRGARADFEAGLFSEWSGPALMAVSRDILSRARAEVFQADLEAGSGIDLRADLGRIRVPALVLTGREDRLIPPARARELAAALPGGEFKIIEKAGHLLMAERYQEVNQAVLEFIDRLTSGPVGPGPEKG